jgi:hypothetical protein
MTHDTSLLREPPATTARARHPRLGLWYRTGWRLNYMLLGAYGPAQLGGEGQPDPRTVMVEERAERQRALDRPRLSTRRALS